MLALFWHTFVEIPVCISEIIQHHIFAQPIPVQYVYWERCVSEAFFIVMDPGGYGGQKRTS